jgi:hypothetical protein
MIACAWPAAHIAIDASILEALRNDGAEQQMVEAKTRITLPPLA